MTETSGLLWRVLRPLEAPRADRFVLAVAFTRQVLATRGNVAESDLQAIRAAGFGDDEIVEIVANTALNIFTNYFNHVAGTEIDFPVVRAAAAAA